jgi:hypothetical protein
VSRAKFSVVSNRCAPFEVSDRLEYVLEPLRSIWL